LLSTQDATTQQRQKMKKREKSVSPGRRIAPPARRQRGAALLIFLLVLMAGALAYLVSNLTSSEIERGGSRAEDPGRALAGPGCADRLRPALPRGPDRRRPVRPVYGYLPLPDLGTTRNNNAGCGLEGCDAANFAGNALNTTVIGRLPWRTLGIEPLRDAGASVSGMPSPAVTRTSSVSPR
jgi:hypothetical protein